MLSKSFDYVLRSFLSTEIPANKVIEVKPDGYSSRSILYREEGLVLYAPVGDKRDKNRYEIILNKPYTESLHQAYSLYRSENKEEVENKFVYIKDKIPVFIDIVKEMASINGLQKLCDILTEYPEWSLAHLAAHFGTAEAFNHAAVNSQLNSSDGLTGMSPLQVAITTNNIHIVKVLINSKCSLEHLDHQGNSVFHYAAHTNKDIIMALTQGSSPRCLNARNHSGHTPLHLACLADKPECVKALLLGGADVNISAQMDGESSDPVPGYVGDFLNDHPRALSPHDMKFGGTPLHWSSSRPVIEELVDVKCNINARNFQDRTALHVMVTRNRLECVVALLSREADPDLGDCDGNRPLHLAVLEGNVPIIQSLIIFGANLDILNNKGETARHMVRKDQESKLLYWIHAVGASRCSEEMLDCTDGCKADGNYNGETPPPVLGAPNRDILDQMLSMNARDKSSNRGEKGKGKNGRLLCLDGGGIRGLILIQILLEIEKVINFPINNCFDWIAGTSTGGILALGIATGKSMKECLCLYFRMKELTFVGRRPYPSEALENVLREAFGADTVMTDIKKPKVLITGVLADRKPVDLHLFRNYQAPSDVLQITHNTLYELPPPPQEQLIWHVGRATGAAPTYFRAFGRFLDGGLIANNPTLDALTEIAELNLALGAHNRQDELTELSVVVSLGTGLIPVTELKVDVFRPESIWDSVKLVSGISSLGNLLIDQATASDGRVVDRARAWCSSIGVPYYRFTPQMSEDIAMDEKLDEKLVKMLWETKAYMHEHIQEIRELGLLLID